MNEHKAVPNIRFNGFKSNWEKIQLKNYVTWYKGSGLSKKHLNVKNIGAPVIHYSDLYKFSEVVKNVRHWSTINQGKLISNNSILFPSSDVTPNGLARTSALVKNGVKAGGDIIIGTLKTSLSNVFMSYQINRNYKDILRMVSGTTIRHIHATDLSNLSEYITYYPEQQKIGDFFTRLDKLLDLQQQKIDKLELLKKALLQKLFPKHDAKIPELRFKGFEDVWRKHRLKEVSKIIGGGTPDTKNPKYWNGNINWFSPNEIGNSPYAVSSHKKITDLGLKKSSAKLHPAEKTILFTSRAGIGDMAILTKPAATNQGFQSLELNNNVDSYFVYSYGFEIKKKANRLASGSTFLEISKNEMEKITLMFPSEQEQQRIGNFLSKVDQLIELENKKLQNFQQVKKCLLQNMFVE